MADPVVRLDIPEGRKLEVYTFGPDFKMRVIDSDGKTVVESWPDEGSKPRPVRGNSRRHLQDFLRRHRVEVSDRQSVYFYAD
ncbi:hypothetical protein A2773_05150 [Candidatus Gottesmanbacteria bacterium RIFCSPHIGHO2_01_FULL_39_10]|uniref:Uncharacterized protein n=1 Tax=Candidatus Gottesmanbacteria bacterium RIFCSPHIGHO2_01_FULL_39_10 TaxID=1798375 RepID=A0A1F5ZNR9_9BACT|nr:MAG: hypothetical protein A2773_05150 [Candidatus Gottesmanbacteria bacterium RIFCSPHIGHO2_01_FULL_39_10]